MNIKKDYKWIPKKETIGFMNGIIASCIVAFFPDIAIPLWIRAILSTCGICIVLLSSVLIKARDIYERRLEEIPPYDENREEKAWESANNQNLSSNKITFCKKTGTLEYWIPQNYYIMLFLLFAGSVCIMIGNDIKNSIAKQENEKMLGSILSIESSIDSIDDALQQQTNHIYDINTSMQIIYKKTDSLINLNNRLIENKYQKKVRPDMENLNLSNPASISNK